MAVSKEIQNKISNHTEWKNLIFHFLLVATSIFATGFVSGGLNILIPFYTKDILIQEDETYSSTIFALISFGAILCHPISGTSVAYTSCEYMVLVSYVITFTAQTALYISMVIIQSVNSTYYCWCILCFVIGATQSLQGVAIETFISMHFPVHKRGRFMTYQVVTGQFSAMLGAFSNGYLSIHISIVGTLIFNSILTLIFGITLFYIFIPPNYNTDLDICKSSDIKSFSDFAYVWRKIGFKNRLKISHWILPKSHHISNENEQTLSLYKVLRNNVGILFKLSVLAFGQLYTRISRAFILTYQANNISMSNREITHINTFSYISDVGLFLIPGYLMDKFGRKYSLIPSLLLLIIASILISFTTNYYELSMVAILLGAGDGLANGSLNTIASDVAPVDYHGRAKFIGIFYMICGIPGIASPVIIGNLASKFSLFYASMSSVLFAVISLFWTICVLSDTSKYHNKHELDDDEYQEQALKQLNDNSLTIKDDEAMDDHETTNKEKLQLLDKYQHDIYL